MVSARTGYCTHARTNETTRGDYDRWTNVWGVLPTSSV